MWTNIWKKKPDYCSKSNNDLKKKLRSPAENRAGHRNRAWGVSRTSHQKKKKYPPPTLKRDRRCLSHTDRAVHQSLAVFLAFFLLPFLGAPDAVLFHPKLGSDCSGAPSSLRLPTPPHNNWYSWLLILHEYFKGRMEDKWSVKQQWAQSSPTIVNDVHSVENY